jgi:putative peptide zinc metalloprotease protein
MSVDARQFHTAPRLAKQVELLGEYEGSGFNEPHYLLRRADGQVIQLSRLLYLVVANLDRQESLGQVAQRVTEQVGRGLSAEQVNFLVEQKLRPLGILATAGSDLPRLQRPNPLLALKFHGVLLPERPVRVVADALRFLFVPPFVVAVLAGLVAVDAWLFLGHGIGGAARQMLLHPLLVLFVLGLLLVSMAFHECGHAAACRYGGAEPGVMGVGLYILWPAFYTNVTDVYRLGRRGRLRTDLGGVYFNVIFILATAGAYFLTRFEPLLILIVIQHLEILQQFMPFLRLDGYYVVSDLVGVPDLFGRIKPVLRSLLPSRRIDPRVKELRPWTRGVVTAWVLLVIPILGGNLALLVIQGPRFLAITERSFLIQVDLLTSGIRGSSAATVAVGVVSILMLALPVLGLVGFIAQLGVRISRAVVRSPLLKAGSHEPAKGSRTTVSDRAQLPTGGALIHAPGFGMWIDDLCVAPAADQKPVTV